MIKKTCFLLIIISAYLFVTGCSAGRGVGNIFGMPGFIIDPIFYANTEVDGDPVDLGIRDIYAVNYTDDTGVTEDSLYIYFVQKDVDLNDILAGNLTEYVLLRVNDTSLVNTGQTYVVNEFLYQTNFMTWMEVDGKGLYTGDTIEIFFDQISLGQGQTVEGEFWSTLHRNSHLGLAEKFKFNAPVNQVTSLPPTM